MSTKTIYRFTHVFLNKNVPTDLALYHLEKLDTTITSCYHNHIIQQMRMIPNESHFENVDPEHGVRAVGEVIVLVLIGHSEIVLLVPQLLLLQLLCLLNKQVHQFTRSFFWPSYPGQVKNQRLYCFCAFKGLSQTFRLIQSDCNCC